MPEHVLMSEIEIIADGGRRRRCGVLCLSWKPNSLQMRWPFLTLTPPRALERTKKRAKAPTTLTWLKRYLDLIPFF